MKLLRRLRAVSGKITVKPREGFVLADALAGLAVLAIGFALCLGCQSQAHVLLKRAALMHQWRVSAMWKLEMLDLAGSQTQAVSGARALQVKVTPAPLDPALSAAGISLCSIEIVPTQEARALPKVDAQRFCTREGS